MQVAAPVAGYSLITTTGVGALVTAGVKTAATVAGVTLMDILAPIIVPPIGIYAAYKIADKALTKAPEKGSALGTLIDTGGELPKPMIEGMNVAATEGGKILQTARKALVVSSMVSFGIVSFNFSKQCQDLPNFPSQVCEIVTTGAGGGFFIGAGSSAYSML